MAIADFISSLLTGRNLQQIEDDVSLGKARAFGQLNPDASNLDKLKHSYASNLITQRYGPLVAGAAGLGKELLDSLPGRSGFDPADMRANMIGIVNEQDPRRNPLSFLSFLGD